MHYQLAYVIMLVPLVITGSNAQINPADYGLDCSLTEFLSVYSSCLRAYDNTNAITNCQVHCSNIDPVVDCINGIGAVSSQCLTSLSTVFQSLPTALKQMIFPVDVLNQCGIDFQNVLVPCPNLHSFIVPEWSAWAEYNECSNDANSSCVQTRSRQCVTAVSFRPPEPVDGCTGMTSETRACAQNACSTTTMAAKAVTVSNGGSRGFDAVWPTIALMSTCWYPLYGF